MAGRPITSTHPRAARWREYSRKRYAQKTAKPPEFNPRPLERAVQQWRTQ